MSNLRDRIAAAIREADMMWSTDTDPYIEMADAVIVELGLQQEWFLLPAHGTKECRYVTDWQPDE